MPADVVEALAVSASERSVTQKRLLAAQYRSTVPAIRALERELFVLNDRETDLAWITQELAHRAEAWIRETPEQWLWMHRRWKTRPQQAELGDPQAAGRESRK